MNQTEFWLAYLFELRAIFVIFTILGLLAAVVGVALWTSNHMGASKLRYRIEHFEPSRSIYSDDLPTLKRSLSDSETEISIGRTLLKYALPVVLFCFPIALVPSPGDLWEFRVAMMKLDATTPENAKAVQGHVTEVVKALECKHLNINCPEPEKKP